MRPNQVHNIDILKPFRRELRTNATETERTLWQYLKGSQLGDRKFRRQHSVGTYILDFYCPAEQLAIELDGSQHYTELGLKHDEERTAFLQNVGIRVVRFKNEEVENNIQTVLTTIKSNFGKPRW